MVHVVVKLLSVVVVLVAKGRGVEVCFLGFASLVVSLIASERCVVQVSVLNAVLCVLLDVVEQFIKLVLDVMSHLGAAMEVGVVDVVFMVITVVKVEA